MVAPAFKVVSEFQFEIGSALLSTQSLQNEVGKLSSIADEVLFSFQSLGLGIASNLGLVGGGALGVFSNAIKSSEKFRDVQLSLSTVISANRDKLTGTIDSFNDRLLTSGSIIKDVVKDARKFGINEGALLDSTKLLSAQLVPKGLAGDNFEIPRELSRNLLKASPVLGVDPGQVQGQLLRILEGSASLGDTLFRRLKSESSSFSDVKTSQQFNALPAAERLDKLRKGLAQFTSDTEILNDRLNSLAGQFTVLRSLTSGADSIFRRLGEVIKVPIIKVMKEINRVLETQGARIVNVFAELLAPLIEDPRRVIINLLQMRSAIDDVGRTAQALTTGGIFQLFGFLLSKLTKIAGLASPVIGILGVSISVFSQALDQMNDPLARVLGTFTKIGTVALIVGGLLFKFGKLGIVMTFLGAALKVVILPALALFGIFQLLSRAAAIAKVSDAEKIVDVSARFAEVSGKILSSIDMILTPFAMLFNAMARLLAPLFSVTLTMNPLIDAMEITAGILDKLGNGFITLGALMDGSLAALAFFAENFDIVDAITGDGFDVAAGAASKAFDEAFDQFVANAVSKQGQGGNTIVRNNIQVDKIDIKNEFKEQQEPDRVAFTIKDQIMKAALNPVQSVNKGLSSGLQGALTAG